MQLIGLIVSAACGGLHTRAPSAEVGQRAADFELAAADGTIVSLEQLRANGPAVLVFYRGHW